MPDLAQFHWLMVLEIIVLVWAVVDCLRNKELSTTSKIFWLVGIITFLYLLLGPIAYFCFRVYQESRPYLQKLLIKEE